MPYAIHWEPKGVYEKYTGVVTGRELYTAVQKVNNHPDFDVFRYVINDFLDCTALQSTKIELEDTVASAIGAKISNPRFIAAFVVTNDAIIESVLEMKALVKGILHVQLFSNLADARHWISEFYSEDFVRNGL